MPIREVAVHIPTQSIIIRIFNMVRAALFIGLLWLFSGCSEPTIYTEVADKSYLGHPPASVRIIDLTSSIKPSVSVSSDADTIIDVYLHRSVCTNAKSRSLGTEFDGYIRITIRNGTHTIARAQSDFRGELHKEEIQKVYDRLIETLRWNTRE